MDHSAHSIDSYVKNIAEIRILSSPKLSEAADADGYRHLLRDNFIKIGNLAKINRDILDEQVYPYLLGDEALSPDMVELMGRFSDELVNHFDLENLDPGILLMLIEKLLDDAIANRDDEAIVKWLDNEIMACYTMVNSLNRIIIRPDLANAYRIRGRKAVDMILKYIDKDRFRQLSDESKERVLINSRYFSALYEHSDGTKEENDQLYEQLLMALDLSDDAFYRDQLPEYDWDYHIIRTLEYISMLLENNNHRKMSKEQCIHIAELSEKMHALWSANRERFSEMFDPGEMELCIIRARYSAGLISKKEYADGLIDMYKTRDKENLGLRGAYLALNVPLEYILLLDTQHITEAQCGILKDIYHNTISFLQRTRDTGSLCFQFEYAFAILDAFIEIPGLISFEDMCIGCLAAIHPPTYVHTMMVGQITRCLCKHLLLYKPELFDELRNALNLDDEGILEYAWHAAVCHDIGKLAIIDTIMIYGRKILDSEFTLIKQHPDVSAAMMSQHRSTAGYVNVARGHHKWYDDSRGYPEEFSTSSLPERVIINLVTCADCLDAATDTVGRSYNTGKTFDDYLAELTEGSGTRYAPYLAELFSLPEVREDIEYLLKDGRSANYLEIYMLLDGVQTREESACD